MLLDDGISPAMVHLLAYCHSHQEMCVGWNSVFYTCFTIGNGTRQCGVLSPYLYSRYIRGMICGDAENADWKRRDWKSRDQSARVEKAGPENAGPCGTG